MAGFESEAFGLLRLAGASGAPLGWERDRKNRPAGFRTHVAVAIGSALIRLCADRMARRDLERLRPGD